MKSRNKKRLQRHKRSQMKGSSEIPRLVVFRSNRYFFIQVIDDQSGKTLVSCHSKTIDAHNVNMAVAEKIGKEIGKLCIEKGIKKVIFDKNGYCYYGRIKCIADKAREAGLEF
ncbi:MAG: 50S ribosomal protein L18 [Bacilli bacterium]|nr:50S ribosomal protein L18 [Bacilli bacterium]